MPQSVAKTNAKDERLIPSDTNHVDICKLKRNDLSFETILALAKVVVENAPKLVAVQTNTCETTFQLAGFVGTLMLALDSQPQGLDYITLRSHTTVDAPRTEMSNEDGRDIAIVSITKTALATPNSGDATAGSTKGSIEIVPLPTSFEPTKMDPILPCYSLGPHEPNKEFYGRSDELELMDKTLLRDASSLNSSEFKVLRSFALCGMGGMGKTQVAVQYVFTRKYHFEAIFWLHAGDASVLAECFAKIAQDLGLEGAEGGKDLTVSRERVKGWLSHPVRSFDSNYAADDEANWLLVFDNVDDLDVLHDYWPATGHGSVLVTSRDPLAKTSFYTANNGIDLKPFGPQETAQFIKLLTHASTTVKQEDLDTLADTLAGLPLAITQMAGVIRRLRLSYRDFLKVYEQSQQQLYDMGLDKPPPGYTHSLATVWALDTLSAEASSLLQLISLFDPDRIPERMLTDGLSSLYVPNLPNNLIRYYEARKVLIQSSLVTYNEDVGEIVVHRLLQDAARSKMNSDRYVEIFNAAFTLLEKAWPSQSLIKRHNTTRWSDCAALFPSIVRLKNAFQEHPHLKDYKPRDLLATLLNEAGWY